MKKIIFILFLWSTFQLQAQEDKSYQQIRTLKIAHIAAELNLNSEEGDQFWPLYTQYDTKMHAIRHNNFSKYIRQTAIEDIRNLTEAEAKKTVQSLNTYEKDFLDTRRNFYNEVQKIIPYKKLILLKKAEDDFNRKLLKEYKNKK